MLRATMGVIVKICGITNDADARVAAEAGADALGFVFYRRSPRHVEPQGAARIICRLPPHLVKVGVFVDAAPDLVVEAITRCGLNIVQFHGNEPPEYCTQFGVMSMKAFRVRDSASLGEIEAYRTDALLLDAYDPASPGGTGQKFNWELAIEARRFGRPIFLAGGLTPENVGEAVRVVQPYGVDVSSGVETSPGRKDALKVREFIHAAKEARREG
jgi:phosphoribosylanthranilate isomerase